MSTKSILILFLLVCLLSACNLTSSSQIETSPTIPSTPLPFPTPIPPTSLPTQEVILPSATPSSTNQIVLNLANQVIQTLKNQDMLSLSSFVHPVDGIRFSPYAFVQDTDQAFSADKVAGIMADSSVYNWGNYAGSGEPIQLSFPEYYSKFIYDVDYTNAPQVSLNHRLSTGNSIDNSAEFYPGGMVVEYYFPGFDPQYGGMDWRSLRLVFSEFDSTWYLAGIIHDEWTP
jgi:hypothetical protein